MRQLMVLVSAVVIGTSACSSPAPVLTLRGSTPCPPGSGAVETWCDDNASCEFRASTGGVYPCGSLSSSECNSAALRAVEECQASGGSDGGVPPPVSAPCANVCSGCPGDTCSTCTRLEDPRSGCDGALAAAFDCARMSSCDLEACRTQSTVLYGCLCSNDANRLATEARLCGRVYESDCSTPAGLQATTACLRAFEGSGCAAFSSTSCSRCGASGTECAGTCVSLDSDRLHCGRCGNACPSGAACMSGTCMATTCSVVGASGTYPPLPSACLPRCSTATLSRYNACTTQSCAEIAVAEDTTAPTTLTAAEGTLSLTCSRCFNWQLNSCAEELCPSQFDAYISCARAGPASTAETRCASQISTVNSCLAANPSEYGFCADTRTSRCF